MAAVKEMLLETLNDLSYQQLKDVLQLTVSQKDLQDISLRLIDTENSADILNLMFEKMNRSDLFQRLSDTSSYKGKIKKTKTVTLHYHVSNEYI